MRIWLDPDRLASRRLTTTDVVRAIREQNVQVAAGVLGAPPAPADTSVPALGQRARPADHGRRVRRHRRARDAGRADHARARRRPRRARRRTSTRCAACSTTSRRSPSASSSGRAPTPSKRRTRCARRWRRLKQSFPEGVDYRIVYDPTVFVRNSIVAVVETLFEAILLVVIVVMVFLQTWRASIIPLVAVPVSLDRHVRGDADDGLLAEHAVAVRPRPRRSASSWTMRSSSWRTWSGTSSSGCRRSRRPAGRWRKCPGRSSRSRSCCARCSFRRRSSAG